MTRIRMIPAFVVQGWMQQIVDSAGDDSDALFKTIEAASDMNLLTVEAFDPDGRACDITWSRED
jgi:hypothetical protein